MASIFVSHSKEDKDAKHFLLEAFAGTKVKPILEEFEPELPTGSASLKIKKDIEGANALFLLLSKNVEALSHTRDWVNWECGTAGNKDIWVFEPFEALGRITVVSPRVTHLVRYSIADDWRNYIRAIIETYDDSHVLPTLASATGMGAALMEKDRVTGALVGLGIGIAGVLLKDAGKPALGVAVNCWKCTSIYRVHLPEGVNQFRCATCNSICLIQAQQQQRIQANG